MKVLLTAVNAKYIHSNPAVYSLKAAAVSYDNGREKERQAVQVDIAEFTINHQRDDILQEIYRRKPDILAFSCYIWNMEMICALLPDLARILPDTEIWVGGPEVSYDGEDFLKRNPQVTGVMLGEGEATFCQLLDIWKSGERERLEQTEGIAFRRGDGEILSGSPREFVNMDELPFPYRELDAFENRIVYYESSRGCPFSCSYCLSSIDKRVRFRSTELVKQELQFFLDRRTAQVKFVDRTFNCRHSHALEIWSYIREHDNGVTNFHFEIAADLLNEEEQTLLNSMRPGLVQLEIGIQSTNRETIGEIDRIMDFEKLTEVVHRLQKPGNIHLHLDLIAGLPMEGFESFVKSFNDVYRLYPEQLQLGFLKVLKGSKMHRKAEEYGLCFHENPVYEVLFTNWISYDEILKLKAVEEMVEVYYNSNQFSHTIRRLEREFSHPFAMYEALAAHYEKTGRRGQNISRLARFDILREFIGTITRDGIYDELLLLDLYLRENSKSRPSWAKSLQEEKTTALEFYRREEGERKYLPGYQGRSAKQMMHMTHLERFHWRLGGDQTEGESWLLFDYQRRDPLTQDAFVQDVTERIKQDG